MFSVEKVVHKMVHRRYPHILLISLDTLRRDYLGCYGGVESSTPNLDKFAVMGVLVANHVANSSWTLSQHMSLLTGMYPLTHGMLQTYNPPLAAKHTLVSEYLKNLGYQTFGIASNNPMATDTHFGYHRGFDVFQDTLSRKQFHSDQIANMVVECLKHNSQRGPCFLYVHIDDLHVPLRPPKKFRQSKSLYRDTLTAVDHYVGNMFDALRDIGLYDGMVIVIVSDHGCEFGEHGFTDKQVNHYREVLDAALLFKYPRQHLQGNVVTGLAATIDVIPTVLDIVGLPPKPDAQGKSLLPWIDGRLCGSPREVVFSYTLRDRNWGGPGTKPQYEQCSVQTLTHKFIRTHLLFEPSSLHHDWGARFERLLEHTRSNGPLHVGMVFKELYNLVDDPGEQQPVFLDLPEVASNLEAQMDQWIADVQSPFSKLARQGEVTTPEVSEEIKARLRALGYIE